MNSKKLFMAVFLSLVSLNVGVNAQVFRVSNRFLDRAIIHRFSINATAGDDINIGRLFEEEKNKNKNLLKQVADMKSKLESLDHERITANDELQSVSKEKSELISKNETLSKDLNKSNSENGTLKNDINALTSKNVLLEKEISALKQYHQAIFPDTKFIAHRGYSLKAPENTIAAFTLAGEIGFWGVEADVQATVDLGLVTIHDDTVDRTTNAGGVVSQMNFKDVTALTIDAGSHVDKFENLKVPSFLDYLEICNQFNMVPVIEVKFPAANTQAMEKLVEQVRSKGLLEKCIIASFDVDILKAARAASQNIRLEYLQNFGDDLNKAAAFAKEYGNCIVSVNSASVTKEIVDKLHTTGAGVGVWTVDDLSRADSMIEYGVEFITTNAIMSIY